MCYAAHCWLFEAELLLGFFIMPCYPAMVLFVYVGVTTHRDVLSSPDLTWVYIQFGASIGIWLLWLFFGPLRDILKKNFRLSVVADDQIENVNDVAHKFAFPDWVERRRREAMGLPSMSYEPKPDPVSEYAGYQTTGAQWYNYSSASTSSGRINDVSSFL